MERTVYKLVDGKPQPVTVKLGITDGIFTEVTEGLAENDVVVTGSNTPVPTTGGGGQNPFGGGGGQRGFRGGR